MPNTTAAAYSREATAEAERVVAWLRLPAIALLALGQGLAHPNPEAGAFVAALILFSAWSTAVLAWVHIRPPDDRLALLTTSVDVVAISVLALLSGGAFSHARLAFFLVPVTVAFRFRPSITAAAAVVTTAAYVTQAAVHPSTSEPEAARFIATQAGFIAWVGVACALLSLLLERRTALIGRLAHERSRLLADALEAEQRERKALAEELHDNALQNLLSARQDLDEVARATQDPRVERARSALLESVKQLRDAVFELHPYVLAAAGLEAALRTVAQRAAERAGLVVELDLRYENGRGHEPLLFSAARELLNNVVRHAEAGHVTLRLVQDDDEVELAVEDDGRGFAPGELAERLADGHIGLASQRVRIEAAGGRMEVASKPGGGTRAVVRLPT